MIVKKCPNCNAPLVYDETRKVYVCEYCRSELVDDRPQEKEEQPEKKVVVEYRHVNVPAEETPAAAAEKRKKNPGCSRGLFIGFGVFFVLGAAVEISDKSNRAGAIIFLILGIWLLVLGSRRK